MEYLLLNWKIIDIYISAVHYSLDILLFFFFSIIDFTCVSVAQLHMQTDIRCHFFFFILSSSSVRTRENYQRCCRHNDCFSPSLLLWTIAYVLIKGERCRAQHSSSHRDRNKYGQFDIDY